MIWFLVNLWNKSFNIHFHLPRARTLPFRIMKKKTNNVGTIHFPSSKIPCLMVKYWAVYSWKQLDAISNNIDEDWLRAPFFLIAFVTLYLRIF